MFYTIFVILAVLSILMLTRLFRLVKELSAHYIYNSGMLSDREGIDLRLEKEMINLILEKSMEESRSLIDLKRLEVIRSIVFYPLDKDEPEKIRSIQNIGWHGERTFIPFLEMVAADKKASLAIKRMAKIAVDLIKKRGKERMITAEI